MTKTKIIIRVYWFQFTIFFIFAFASKLGCVEYIKCDGLPEEHILFYIDLRYIP